MKKALPAPLKIYEKEAMSALKKKDVVETEFARGTYQVLVRSQGSEEASWVFLQLSNEGDIKDAFCCAEDEDDNGYCFHIALSYLSLFKDSEEPLHVRFEKSFWYAFCKIYEADLGDDFFYRDDLISSEIFYSSPSGKKIFELKIKSEAAKVALKSFTRDKHKETEETSLKFSNLSSEELFLWKSGRPDEKLRFDLSLWSDLAKWLMSKQEENEPYVIEFVSLDGGLPYWIHIDFKDIEIGFYISKAKWPTLIESLQTVKSPLHIYYPSHTAIKEITYEKESGALYITRESSSFTKNEGFPFQKGGIQVADWMFFSGQGFYATDSHHLLENSPLYGLDIAHALNEHTQLVASHLINCHLEMETTPLSYFLEFDRNDNLHITAYLFESGDLTRGDSWLIEDWAYLDDDGFYRIGNRLFNETKKVIPKRDIESFIAQNRSWLDKQEGFQTHITAVEYELSYVLNAKGRLTFNKSSHHMPVGDQCIEFGSWVYIKGRGFFIRKTLSFGSLLRPGLSISREQVPLFIKMHCDELQLIPHFFITPSPVLGVSLNIELDEKEVIRVSPHYSLLEEYERHPFIVMDDVIYFKDKGFVILTPSVLLPEAFREECRIKKSEVAQFLREELPQLSAMTRSIDKRLIKPLKYSLMTDFVAPAKGRGKGWIDLRFYYLTENGYIPVVDLIHAHLKKREFFFSNEGLIDLKEERFEWIRNIPKERLNGSFVSLTSLEFMRLNAFDPITFFESDTSQSEDSLHKSKVIFKQLTDLKTPEEPVVDGLLSHLRHYQEIGLRWLWFLYRHNLSGLLCDDMGLGKTHQAMALLCSIKNLFNTFAEGICPKFLIVCPTSVLFHWQEKLQEFLPHFKILTFYGSKRSYEELKEDYHIILTSYGMLRIEQNELSKIAFEACIFDEVQVAKNHLSKVYSSLLRINTQVKIGLTGTPIENHLRELKAIFDLILPSYMPSDKRFKDLFIRSIERDNNVKMRQLLSRLIHPFVLRRRKKDVLTELPDKIEEVAHCTLSPVQEELYSDALLKRRGELLQEIEDEKSPVPYLHVFSLLSSLKQICDHPAVYLKNPYDYHKYPSGKWDLFLELLREARESEQKVVVFSQYLHMLDIIESYLTEKQIGFSAIRGSTSNRREQVQTFQNDPKCEVFVGSLHAAGLGIDLTAASVVIHYDRWWNAAKENQATDRVHRMGQTRGVQVFKLVTVGTFEEKIDKMIRKKGALLEEVVGADDKDVLKTFSRDELAELLENITLA